jgi:hypothetical protein
MAYAATEFPSFAELRGEHKQVGSPEALTEEMMQECKLLFEMMAQTIGNYVSTGETEKLGLLLKALEMGLNESIEKIEERMEVN